MLFRFSLIYISSQYFCLSTIVVVKRDNFSIDPSADTTRVCKSIVFRKSDNDLVVETRQNETNERFSVNSWSRFLSRSQGTNNSDDNLFANPLLRRKTFNSSIYNNNNNNDKLSSISRLKSADVSNLAQIPIHKKKHVLIHKASPMRQSEQIPIHNVSPVREPARIPVLHSSSIPYKEFPIWKPAHIRINNKALLPTQKPVHVPIHKEHFLPIYKPPPQIPKPAHIPMRNKTFPITIVKPSGSMPNKFSHHHHHHHHIPGIEPFRLAPPPGKIPENPTSAFYTSIRKLYNKPIIELHYYCIPMYKPSSPFPTNQFRIPVDKIPISKPSDRSYK